MAQGAFAVTVRPTLFGLGIVAEAAPFRQPGFIAL